MGYDSFAVAWVYLPGLVHLCFDKTFGAGCMQSTISANGLLTAADTTTYKHKPMARKIEAFASDAFSCYLFNLRELTFHRHSLRRK